MKKNNERLTERQMETLFLNLDYPKPNPVLEKRLSDRQLKCLK